MTTPHVVMLPDDRRWLRVADASWEDPLDPTFADRVGGRWNTPGDGPTLYLCEDVSVARAQIQRLLEPTPIDVTDLADDAPFVLVTATLPERQRVADATSDTGLRSLGLPTTYPLRPRGGKVPWRECRRAAHAVRARALRGVLARSAVAGVGPGHELAWFPAPRAHARAVGKALPFVRWRHEKPSG
ncbi:MAG: RES domain-containing protein [Candidatus Nanopelagicales bacterium]